MKWMRVGGALVLFLIAVQAASTADKAVARSPKEALQAFNDLIGPWRATGTPEGTQQEKQRGFWTESMDWAWQFKGNDTRLQFTQDKGKYFTKGDLRYLPDKDLYQLDLVTPGKETLSFEGAFKDNRLTLERSDEAKKETQRLTFTFLHANRFLYRYEVKPADKAAFAKVYEVGVTKQDVAFAGPADNQPECIVSGGLGKIPVTYKGQTYYVCCTGCRDAFKDDPEKYLKEYAERKAKEKKDSKTKEP
jgi:hypothetical protein